MKRYSEKYRLTYDMINRYDQLSLCAMMDIFQDVANLHSIQSHNSFEELKEKKMFWVVTRMKIIILDNYFSLDLVNATTWHNKSTRFDVNRQFLLLQDDKEKVKISSKWVVINSETRGITSMSDVFLHEEYDELEFSKLKKIRPFDLELDQSYSFTVEASMIDRNLHMNNSQYAIVIYNAIKLKANELIKSFEIDFIKELRYLQKAKVAFVKVDKMIYIKIYSSDNIVNARAVIELK